MHVIGAAVDEPPAATALRGRGLARAGRLDEALAALLAAVDRDEALVDAHVAIYEVAQLLRREELALAHQRRAIELAPIQSTRASQAEELALLVLCAPGPYTANTPVDLLFDPRFVTLYRWYVDPAGSIPELPRCDAVFVAIGESDAASEHLSAAERFLARARLPHVNDPAGIRRLGRVPLREAFTGSRSCRVVQTSRIRREAYARAEIAFPHIARPVDAHGGHGLARIANDAERASFLAGCAAQTLYVAPFIDYRSADGFYRKYRIIFVDGEAYPFHLAISPHWMVHYYNAPMAEHAWMRDEERAFLEDMTTVFDGDLGGALRDAAARLGLDYVGIDCAIDRDGTLLIFEADNALIVHALDDGALFGYKQRPVRRILDAVATMVRRRIAAHAVPRDVEPTSLDPENWEQFRETMHRALDAVVDDLAGIREQPAWQPVPDVVKDALREPLPRKGEALEATLARYDLLVRPYSTGNRHPRFFGWVHGAGTAAGVLAELLAGGLNANVGGREHAAVYVERAVLRWFIELFGLPEGASGVLTSGTSMANLLAVVAARDAARGSDADAAIVPLSAYAASGVHDSIRKALRIAGLGGDALRTVPAGAGGIDIAALRAAIERDRRSGTRPFLVVGTAGSVDTGSFDDLDALAELCADEKLWLHVDGAFGALAIASPQHRHLVRGIERADSLAFDAHKWLHAPYGAGVALFRDEAAHRAAFASEPEYLRSADRGTAAGGPWFSEYGLELSREFRALKVWFTLRHYGIERLGASIAGCCALAQRLAAAVERAPELELLAPVALNVVCFRYVRGGLAEDELDALNAELAIVLQERGETVLSTARVGGKRALRACIVNHRTDGDDVDAAVAAVREAARTLS